MIVLDASAAIELLLATDLGHRVEQAVFATDELVNAPHLLDAEVAQVLVRLLRKKQMLPDQVAACLADLRELSIIRHAHVDLLERMVELGANATAYDATYLALAEALDARLVTCDRKLARVPGSRAKTVVIK